MALLLWQANYFALLPQRSSMICWILAEGLAGGLISYVLDGIDASDLPAMDRHFISMLRKSLNGVRYRSIASSISW